jgi:hypothetical protein
MMKRMRVAPILCLVVTLLWGPAAAADPEPVLVISYTAAVADRPAFLQALEDAHSKRLFAWQREGLLKTHELYLNRYADEGTWDAIAVLSFADIAGLQTWNRIERRSPGGLPGSARKLVKAIQTTQVDLFRHAGPNSAPARDSAYLIVPYDYLVSLAQYKSYLDQYTFPQFAGWMEEGALRGYSFYLARYPAGRNWTALLILDYVSDDTLAQRDAVMAKVRARLAQDPVWKSISDNKQAVREEGQLVVADRLVP